MKAAAAIILFALPFTAAAQDRTAAPADAEAFFITPEDGALVASPLTLVFGLRGMEVAPAGTDKENTGHHHLIIDTDLPAMDEPIPSDDQHLHFGGGQTQTELELEPGEHSLQLLLGDLDHVPHDPPVMSEKITIVVE